VSAKNKERKLEEANEKKKERRPHGTGSVFLRPGSSAYYAQFTDHGRRYCVSTGETSITKARNVLKDKIVTVRSGKYLGPTAEKITVEELVQDAFTDQIVNGKKDTVNPKLRWENHLKGTFGLLKACEVKRALLDRYVKARLEEKASNATIVKELALLKRALNLGVEHEKIYATMVPVFPHLEEKNVREGFPSDEEYRKLKDACRKEGIWLRAMLELAATFGWRKGSLLRMRVSNVDLLAGTVREEGSTTKSGQGNEVKMTPDLRALLQGAMLGKKPDDYLFTRVQIRKSRKRPTEECRERPVVDFRSAWRRATKASGKPDLHFHDLCRFAARRLDRAGVGQKTAMAVMGRKTDSIYRRYNVVDHRDRDLAVDRLVEYQQALAKAAQTAAEQKQHRRDSMQFDRQSQVGTT
jgi:integrase